MASQKIAKKYKSVMLIDDNELDNIINGKMIESCSFADQVYIHSSGSSALEFLKNLENSKNEAAESLIPEVLFLDINMPIMDGHQFLKSMAKILKPKTISSFKIFMLSASQNETDISEAANNKLVTKIFTKPLTLDILADI